MNLRQSFTARAAALLLISGVAGSHAAEWSQSASASSPRPRTDANSLVAHQQLLQKAKQGRIDVYFLGDSINAANFGWGADRIENILWRVENGELDGVNPKAIVILAGINNVGTVPGGTGKVQDISNGIRALLRTCQMKATNATVVLTGIFPRNDNMAVIPEIREINRNIASMADGKKVRYVDVNSKLADDEGKLFPGMMNPDKLHPALKGYQVWADALKPILTELLGPPAAVDLAPPPTGDPSSTKAPQR